MGLFHDFMKEDSKAFLDEDVFGEAIVYVPLCGTAKSIIAIVNRNSLTPIPDSRVSVSNELEISIFNDSTLGVDKISINGDKVLIVSRLGDPVKEHRVTEILSQDVGMWRLKIKA